MSEVYIPGGPTPEPAQPAEKTKVKRRSYTKTSPTQRSLKVLRDRGYTVAIVERWNPHARLRQDLFGIIDLLAIGDGETIGVQTTSADHVSHRIRKLEESEALPKLRKANWRILVHGWRKNSQGRWVLREEDIS